MWLAGMPIKQIQMLCGNQNQNENTTEIDIKARWSETAQRNKIAMVRPLDMRRRHISRLIFPTRQEKST